MGQTICSECRTNHLFRDGNRLFVRMCYELFVEEAICVLSVEQTVCPDCKTNYLFLERGMNGFFIVERTICV